MQTFNVNSLNELTRVARSGTLTAAGTATEPKGGYSYPGWPPGVTNVTVNTSNAVIYADGSFAATNFTLVASTNPFTAIAQDTYGREATNSVNPFLPINDSMDFDLNGNLLRERSVVGGTNRSFAYDDENQLVAVWVANTWSNNFAYDGLLRKRLEKDFSWNGSTWTLTNEVHFIYDGSLVIQERDGNNQPRVTYTRGNDLSGSLQGAGGIGGLLARTDNGQLIGGSPWATACYYYDGNGNVMGLVYTNGLMAAQYAYDPYGNTLTKSGPLADANDYRFSSKEWNGQAGIYYYGYRFYDPGLQRWPNRDPIGERGGLNLYAYVANSPINLIDALGLSFWGRVGNGFTGAAAGAASGAGTGAAAGAVVGAIGGAGVGAGPGAVAGAGAGAIAGAIGGFIGGVLSGPNYSVGQSASAGAINGALAGITGGAANVGGVAWGAGAGALSGGTAAGLSSDGNPGAIAGGALFGAGMGFGAGAAEEDAIAGFIFPPTAELWGQDIGNYVEFFKGPKTHCP